MSTLTSSDIDDIRKFVLERGEDAVQRLYAAVHRTLEAHVLDDLPCYHKKLDVKEPESDSSRPVLPYDPRKQTGYMVPMELLQKALLATLAPRYLYGFTYHVVDVFGGTSFIIIDGLDGDLLFSQDTVFIPHKTTK